MFKYQGLAILAEYAKRNSPNPLSIKTGSKTLYIYDGTGLNAQISYMLTDKLQCALRYTNITPSIAIESLIGPRSDYVAALSHYFNGHDLKLICDSGLIVLLCI